MIQYIHVKRSVIALALAAVAAPSFSQVQPTGPKSNITEEVEVVRAYKPVLADAVKIRRSPDLETTKPFKANLTYTIPDVKLDLDADIQKLQAQLLPDEAATRLLNNYVAAGAGSLNTGLAEVYLNTGKDEALQAGAWFKHLNQEGPATGAFFRDQAGVFGRSITDKLTLDGDLGFSRTSFRFYGIAPPLTPVPNPQKQFYNLLTLTGKVNSREEASAAVDFFGEAKAYLLKNAFEGSESSVILGGGAGKAYNNFYFGLNASVDVTGTKDAAYDISNVIFKGNPYVTYRTDRFKLRAGVSFFSESLQSRTNILPDVQAEAELIPGFATLFGNFTGAVLKTSLRDLSTENRFINANIAIKNALQRRMAEGGIRGNAGSGFGYKVSAFYKTIEDMPLFVNTLVGDKFDIRYDGSTDILGFEGEISYKAPGLFKLIGKVTATDYNTSTEAEAWAKPNLQIWSSASFFINDKLTINGEVWLNGGSNVLGYDPSLPVPVFKTTVGSFADLSAGAEYRIRQKVGLFVRVNNLFDQNYQRYQYYTVNGINATGGLNYSF